MEREQVLDDCEALEGGSMKEVGRAVAETCSKEEYEIWAVTLYSIWSHICWVKHGQEGPGGLFSIEKSKGFVVSYKEARLALRAAHPLGVQVGERKWFPPMHGFFRLDVDASVNDQARTYGVGVVVRDSKGKIRAALTKSIICPDSVLDAEINVVLFGVGLCLQEGLVPFVIYSDSLLAIRMLADRVGKDSYINIELPILAEVISNGYIKDFCHMYREANMVAHTLARYGAGCDGMSIWNSEFPHWLREMVE